MLLPQQDSDNSDLSDFEDENMSQDEISRILAHENTNLLEQLHWLNSLKLKKWEKQFTRVDRVTNKDSYYMSKDKRDIYRCLCREIEKKLSFLKKKRDQKLFSDVPNLSIRPHPVPP